MNESAAPVAAPGSGGRRFFRAASAAPEVLSVTNAAEAHSAEMRHRMVKYATAMGIRMVCIGLIFAVDGWYRLLPIVGAVLLPWIAVVIANGGADLTAQKTTALLDTAPVAELPAPAPAAAEPVILTGDFLLSDDSKDAS